VVRRRKGLTGLETAIILIAFIIVAAAFAFTVLNMGFFTTQRSKEVIKAGMEEAASSVELAGNVVAMANGSGTPSNGVFVQNITIYVKSAVGKQPISMANGSLVISYTDPYKHVENIYDGSNSTCLVLEVEGDGDKLLEYGEVWKIVVKLNGTLIYNSTATSLQPNDKFSVEIKPHTGSILTVERMLPQSFDPVMNLL